MPRRASGPQKRYIKTLASQVGGERRASEISQETLGFDAWEPCAPFPSAPWRKETRLDHLRGFEATRLINALLDVAGRDGRRKNNRRRTA